MAISAPHPGEAPFQDTGTQVLSETCSKRSNIMETTLILLAPRDLHWTKTCAIQALKEPGLTTIHAGIRPSHISVSVTVPTFVGIFLRFTNTVTVFKVVIAALVATAVEIWEIHLWGS